MRVLTFCSICMVQLFSFDLELRKYYKNTKIQNGLHTCVMQFMRYMCMHVRSNMLCCPSFVDLTPKFDVRKHI